MQVDLSTADLGPKMLALDDRGRLFVWYYVLNGGNGAQAARDAGYSDTADGAKVQAHRLLHSKKVLDAVMEMGLKTFRGLIVPAVSAARIILENPKHPAHQRMIDSVLDRVGLPARSGLDVNQTVTVTDKTGAELADRITRFAQRLGMDAQALLGVNVPAPEMKLIDGEKVDAVPNDADREPAGG